MIRKTFFIKLFLTYLGVLVFFILSAAWIGSSMIRGQTEQILVKDLEKICQTLLPQIRPLLISERSKDLDALIIDQGSRIQTRLTVILPDGTVPADSRKDHLAMESHWDRPEFTVALQGRTGHAFRFSTTLGRNMLYVAVPVIQEGKVIAVMRASLSITEVEDMFASLRLRLTGAVLISLVLALLFALWISRNQSRPIEHLIGAVREVSQGGFNTKVLMKASGEFRELADAFNLMTEKIRQLFDHQSREREKFDLVLSSLQEGLVVIDRERLIALANPSFCRMVRAAAPQGKPYWEVVRSPEFSKAMNTLREKKDQMTIALDLHESFYLCSLTPLTKNDEVIAVFFDITERKKIEDIKRDLAANISHEFRTPLTSIMGFVEALEEEENLHHKEYLEIIKRNTHRLTAITRDLLLLSQIESGRSLMQIEILALSDMTQSVLRMFQPLAMEKGLILEQEIAPDLPPVPGDRYLIEQMLINLLENALRYTEKGKIILRIRQEGHMVIVEVSDTGVGIPTKEWSRIFERFYVVDRSRSRRLGGTGLGLSIVRNIAHQHGGRIEVKSRIGEGSTFTVYLPKEQFRHS